MKKYLLFFFTLLLISCEIEYDGETKIVVKGSAKDENNTAISNKEINLLVSRNSSYIPFLFYYPSETDYVGKAITDENGNFTMVFPKPTHNYSEIIVEINDESNFLISKRIVNITPDDFNNYELNLGENLLYEKSNLCVLQVNPIQINPDNELLEIKFVGEIADEIVYFNYPENYTYYYETQKKVRKNQTILLNYKVRNIQMNTVSELQETVIIDNSNELIFDLNY